MEEYSIKNFSTNKFFLYLILAFSTVISLTLLTYRFVGAKIYPGITFLVMTTICVLWIKNNCWNFYKMSIADDYLRINHKTYKLVDVRKYAFSETEKFYGFKLVLKSYKLVLNIPKNDSADYFKFKKKFIKAVTNQKINNSEGHYVDWHKSKSAKIFAYTISLIILFWLVLMFIYPEKLGFYNVSLFVVTVTGLFPIFYKIFTNKQ